MGYGRGGNSGGRGGGGRRQEYDNELKGVLFKNEQRRNDKDPYYQGQAQVQGVEYWVSAWINEDQQGNKRINFNLTEKEQRRGGNGQGYNRQNARNRNNRDEEFDDHDRQRGNGRRAGPPPRNDEMDDDLDDDIPF